MRRQLGIAFVLKCHDTVPATCVRRAGMRLRTIEAKHIAGLREPNLAIAGQELSAIKIAEQANQTETKVVFVTVKLSDRVCVDLERTPHDTIGRRKQR